MRTVTVAIERERPLSGRVRADGQPDRPFTGWLALITALRSCVEGPAEQGLSAVDAGNRDA